MSECSQVVHEDWGFDGWRILLLYIANGVRKHTDYIVSEGTKTTDEKVSLTVVRTNQKQPSNEVTLTIF